MKKILLCVFLLIASNTVFAANWIKFGANADSEVYYDEYEIEIVKYMTENGRNARGVRLKLLENLQGPTFKRDTLIFKQAIQSSVKFVVFDCYDYMMYLERAVWSSAKYDRGTLVHEVIASPDSIYGLYSAIQRSKEEQEEINIEIQAVVDDALRWNMDPKKKVKEYLSSNPKSPDPDSRYSFKGRQIEKVINKLCALSR